MADARTFADFAEQAGVRRPEVALILGSGMSGLADRCQVLQRLPFLAVPGLAATSISGHAGCLALVEWAGKRVLVFEGRVHFYEGHPWRTVVEPIRLAHFLGAPILVLTNAAGGIRDDLRPGCFMAIRDQIDWTWPYAWREPGLGGLSATRLSPYSPRLLQFLEASAREQDIELQTGVYAGVTGPGYETPAEIRALRAWGADAVGMSTTREAQYGYDLGLECAALSLITNRAAGLSAGPINHDEVLATAAAERDRLASLLDRFLRLI
jgi:purine-nucleoside phosphorylase